MSQKLITKKQTIILLLIYTFRFLNSKQIQEFLGHKDHKRINVWLKDLTNKGFVFRDFNPVYGTLTKPAVYNLLPLGRKYIKNTYQNVSSQYIRRISRDTHASKGIRIKYQILADWYLTLFFRPPKMEKRQDIEEFAVIENEKNSTGIKIIDSLLMKLLSIDENETIPLNQLQFYTSSNFPNFKLLERVKPDGYIRRRAAEGVQHGLIFIIDSYATSLLLRYKLRQLFEAIDEENWAAESDLVLQIYFLCPNNQVIIYLKRAIDKYMNTYYGEVPLLISFATRNQLYLRKEGKTEKVGWKTISSSD